MSFPFIIYLLVLGFSGITAQVLLLRELLVSFSANELSIGLILGNWIALEALGVVVIDRCFNRDKGGISLLIILQMMFSLGLPLGLYLCRAFKGLLGFGFGETAGLSAVMTASIFSSLIPAFSHGALFSLSCRLSPRFIKNTANSAAFVYGYEMLGTLGAGLALTFFLIPQFKPFQIAYLVSLLNFLIIFFIIRRFFKQKRRYIYVSMFVVLLALSILIKPAELERISLLKQWQNRHVVDYRNSVYGNLVEIKQQEQDTFFYNGIPVISVPYPDMAFVEEFGQLPLLFSLNTRNILVLSGGAGGIINEILKYPIESLDYAEMDPTLITMLKSSQSQLIRRELSNSKVNIINKDARNFLQGSGKKYDLILLGFSAPVDLAANRFFSREFFALAKERLNSQGILAFSLPGSSTYQGFEERELNSCIYKTLKNVYDFVRVIPGDYNIYLASPSPQILEVDSAVLIQRLSRQGIVPKILVPSYIEYRLDKQKSDRFIELISGSSGKINRDLHPQAVYQMLVFLNKQSSAFFSRALGFLGCLKLWMVSLLIGIVALIWFLFRRGPKLNIAYSVANTGFFVMLMNLILIFSFQSAFGYLYYQLGLLIAILMAGIAAGSFTATFLLKINWRLRRLLVGIELLIVLFSLLSALLIEFLFVSGARSYLIFISLFFATGFLGGIEFPLAVKIYSQESKAAEKAAGLLYACDLTGGWLAGIAGAVVILPVLGVINSCMVLAILKASSMLLLILGFKLKIRS